MTRLACLAHVALAATLLLLASCADGNSGVPQCEDGFDNDRDGYVDGDDPACKTGGTTESQDPPASCEDGLDNDGDGKIDFPDDPGCTDADDLDEFSVGPHDCSDGLDNDSDGKVDFPADPGCRALNQMNEGDDCPAGVLCPQCGDGQDDDFDGLNDFPADPGCASASDAFEYNLDTMACGVGTTVAELPASGVVTGTIGSGASNLQAATCSGGAVGTGAEAAYAFLVEEPTVLVATTNLATTLIDTVLYVRRACRTGSTELACNDDINASNNRSSITATLAPGAYYLIVDAKTAGSNGNYAVQATFYRGLGQSCTGPAQCAPGFDCRTPVGGSGTSCERPVCSDGRDDDGDTKIDFPNDPGCTGPDDGTEADTCPTGLDCPDCGDGVDNDGDTRIDYPLDTSCASASGVAEYSCTTVDPVRTFATNLTAQPMSTLANDIDLSCGNPDGRDDVFALNITRPLSELYIDTIGSTIDTVLTLKRGSCSSFELQCDDNGALNGDSRIFLIDVLPGEYYLVVDDKNTPGTYNLNIRGVIANGGSCDPASTAFTCALGYACTGAVGMTTCTPAICNDAIDQDGDTFPGYPTDPGCTSPSDNDETDACPGGAGCPLCSNDLDDDGDTFIDYGVDPGCVAASSNSELAPCTTADPVILLSNPTIVNATTAGRTNDIDLSCGADGRDEIYRLNVSRPLATLTVDTIGSALDTVVAIRGATCNGTTDLACDDDGAGNSDSRVTLTNVGVGEYFVIVDDRTNSNLTYNLNVSATIAPGGSCDPLSTVFTCTTGHACQGATPTCQLAACNNNVDDDGNGDGVGYPVDPGCTSTSDNTEADDCPSGPMCPACSNDLDDDADLLIDYPLDPGCSAASVNSELAPCTSMDVVPIFTANVVAATTMGRANDLDLSCGGDGRDMIYRYYVTQPMISLTVDTFASDTSTAVAIRRGTCNGTTDLACGVNNFGTNDARATLTPVPAGEYFFIVDDLNTTTPTTFNLNVSGQLAGGARCDPASTTFTCEAGYRCAGAAGAETCIPTVCNDTIDADGDGKPGYPTDPGCANVSDGDETDDCPAGPNCPDCADGVDNDLDLLIDFPADTGCIAASSLLEVSCLPETDPVLSVTMPVSTGTTIGATHNITPTCSGGTAPDRIHVLALPVPVATLTVDTVGATYDTVLAILDSSCGISLGCNDDAVGLQSRVTLTNLTAGTYSIDVDGFSGNSGPYTLNVRGTVANGTACTHSLFTAGVLACTAPATCNAGTGVCQ